MELQNGASHLQYQELSSQCLIAPVLVVIYWLTSSWLVDPVLLYRRRYSKAFELSLSGPMATNAAAENMMLRLRVLEVPREMLCKVTLFKGVHRASWFGGAEEGACCCPACVCSEGDCPWGTDECLRVRSSIVCLKVSHRTNI